VELTQLSEHLRGAHVSLGEFAVTQFSLQTPHSHNFSTAAAFRSNLNKVFVTMWLKLL
jgi:hypothetical protein